MDTTFIMFRLNLPVEIRGNNQAIDTIERIGKRVVAIEVLVPPQRNRRRPKLVRGSGLVFKAKGEYYLQTADHCSVASEHLLVKFHFDDDGTNEQYAELRNNAFIGNCFERDKAIYHLASITHTLEEDPNITDLGPLVVGIDITDRLGFKGFVECFKSGNRVHYCVHVTGEILRCAPNSITLVFNNGAQGNPQRVERCGPTATCSRVILNDYQVPEETKMLFNRELPWDVTPNTKVATISHPKGKPKKVSWGGIIEDGTNGPPPNPNLPPRSFKDVEFVKHSCDTAGGSSGGAVIVIGKDFKAQLGYNSYLGMHHRVTSHETPGKLASIGLIY